jgi:hypothetical protein
MLCIHFRVSMKQDEAGTDVLVACFVVLFSCLTSSSILNMEAICSSETSADFYLTTWRYIPKDRTLH